MIKKAGYFGTLDPFAHGTLIIAFGAYTKLFSLMQQNVKKRYVATLMLGAKSATLDSEAMNSICGIGSKKELAEIKDALSIHGTLNYYPPEFSAKKINGERAYSLARKGAQFELAETSMSVYECKLLSYNHPFVRFEVLVNSGAYVRKLGEIIAKKLSSDGALVSLERTAEHFPLKIYSKFNKEIDINPIELLGLKTLDISDLQGEFNGQILQDKDLEDAILVGKKMTLSAKEKNLKSRAFKLNDLNSQLCIKMSKTFCVLDFKNNSYSYVLNAMELS